jgi:hypothetical protein
MGCSWYLGIEGVGISGTRIFRVLVTAETLNTRKKKACLQMSFLSQERGVKHKYIQVWTANEKDSCSRALICANHSLIAGVAIVASRSRPCLKDSQSEQNQSSKKLVSWFVMPDPKATFLHECAIHRGDTKDALRQRSACFVQTNAASKTGSSISREKQRPPS